MTTERQTTTASLTDLRRALALLAEGMRPGRPSYNCLRLSMTRRLLPVIALALALRPAPAHADGLEGLEPIMKVSELLIPDLGLVFDADSANVALAFPLQVHLWQREGACSVDGCAYRPWLAALIEPQWASGSHGFGMLGGVRTYFPLRRRIGPGAPSVSVDVAAVGGRSGAGFAVGAGASIDATPFAQTVTPRYRYVWSAEPRHEIYLDLLSFGWRAKQ